MCVYIVYEMSIDYWPWLLNLIQYSKCKENVFKKLYHYQNLCFLSDCRHYKHI